MIPSGDAAASAPPPPPVMVIDPYEAQVTPHEHAPLWPPPTASTNASAGCSRTGLPSTWPQLRPGGFADLSLPSQRRPFRLSLPQNYDTAAAPLPLLIFFHGWDGALSDGQAFHADGPLVSRDVWAQHCEHHAAGPADALSESPGLDGAALPAHSLTIFVPLVDYDVGDGVEPTNFLPGSHQQPTAAALKAEAVEAGSSGGAGVPAPLDAAAGDAILFDLRTHHAGGANMSGERRSSSAAHMAWDHSSARRASLAQRSKEVTTTA